MILALSVDSRQEVDEMVNKAFEEGGKPSMDNQDMGWMDVRSFQDLDGHLWEVLFLDVNPIPSSTE